MRWIGDPIVCALLNDLESKKMFIGSNHQISNGLLHFFFLRLIFPSVFLERNLFSGNFLVVFSHFFRFVLISYVCAPSCCIDARILCNAPSPRSSRFTPSQECPQSSKNLHLRPKISRLDRFRYGNLFFSVYHLPIAQLSELSISKRN